MRKVKLMVCITAVIVVSCSQNKTANTIGTSVREYKVITVSPESATIHQEFPATIEGQRVIEIRPMINGYLKEMYVNEGDQVRKGQILFRINNPQYEQEVITARAMVNSAMADVNSASLEVEKIKPLVEKEIVSNYRLKSAELVLESRKAALEQARAQLSNAETNLAYTTIKSPENGIIGTIPYKSGALVSSNSAEALTTLSDIENVFAYFSRNEKQLLDMLSATKGDTPEEKINNLPEATLVLANDDEYPEKGKVELASGLISTMTGAATFKAIFPNRNGLIRSGSSATVRLPEKLDSVYVIPQSATYELQNKSFVYTLGTDNKVTAVTFTSLPSDDGKFYYVTSGLKSGDKVVVEGISSLRNGVQIKPKEETALSYNNQKK